LDAGRPLAAAEVVGAAAHLRGAEDPGSPAVRRVVERGRRQVAEQAWDEAFRRGRALDRATAIARLDPDRLDEDDPAPHQGDGVAGAVGAGQARRR
jgi:hypothetical protein